MRGHASDWDDDDEPLAVRRPWKDEAKFDITAMIDLVFMLNIFFLVTTVAAALAEMDLPVVRHCIPTDGETATVISVAGSGRGEATVFVGEPGKGAGFNEEGEISRVVRDAVEAGIREEKRVVLIKAERETRLRDVRHVAAAAGGVPGVELRMAVIERE